MMKLSGLGSTFYKPPLFSDGLEQFLGLVSASIKWEQFNGVKDLQPADSFELLLPTR